MSVMTYNKPFAVSLLLYCKSLMLHYITFWRHFLCHYLTIYVYRVNDKSFVTVCYNAAEYKYIFIINCTRFLIRT